MSSSPDASARRDVRPPVPTGPAPPSGAPGAPRRTVLERPRISPRPWLDDQAFAGFLPSHPYVRRYWTALLGPGAVADLLRLTVAAVRGTSIRLPTHIELLAREGLVAETGGAVLVRPTVPELTSSHLERLPPALRTEITTVGV